jgi:hypothetical protein
MIDGMQRLTFSTEGDWSPAWLSDGSGIGYSAHRHDRTDRDRCLAWLPASGGRAFRTACLGRREMSDTADVLWTHAVGPAGRIAFVYQASSPTRFVPSRRGLFVGEWDRIEAAAEVVNLPYVAETGVEHHVATDLVWVNPHTIAYLARSIQYVQGGRDTPADTVVAAVEIVVVDLDPVPSRRTVPGTAGATSLALDRGSGLVYTTFALDSVVYRLELSSGERVPVANFGSLGVVRGIQVAQGRIVGIVGGFVTPASAATFGVDTQLDRGGFLAMLPLAGGTPQLLTPQTTRVFLSAALSPDGTSVVAEGFAVAGGSVAPASDLWLVRLP